MNFKKTQRLISRTYRKLYNALQGKKKARLDRFLYPLGIHHVGHHVAMVLARKFGSLKDLRNASLEDVREHPEIAESIKHFFEEKENLRVQFF